MIISDGRACMPVRIVKCVYFRRSTKARHYFLKSKNEAVFPLRTFYCRCEWRGNFWKSVNFTGKVHGEYSFLGKTFSVCILQESFRLLIHRLLFIDVLSISYLRLLALLLMLLLLLLLQSSPSTEERLRGVIPKPQSNGELFGQRIRSFYVAT